MDKLIRAILLSCATVLFVAGMIFLMIPKVLNYVTGKGSYLYERSIPECVKNDSMECWCRQSECSKVSLRESPPSNRNVVIRTPTLDIYLPQEDVFFKFDKFLDKQRNDDGAIYRTVVEELKRSSLTEIILDMDKYEHVDPSSKEREKLFSGDIAIRNRKTGLFVKELVLGLSETLSSDPCYSCEVYRYKTLWTPEGVRVAKYSAKNED